MSDLKINGATQTNPTIPTKQSVLGITNATTAANGTQYLRGNWSSSISYIGDMTTGGYGILCGALQCNVTETLASPTTVNTIYGFAVTQTGSIRMCGHGASNSEDIWYGASGNSTVILNNQGNRTYTQYAANTFAIPVQKKY